MNKDRILWLIVLLLGFAVFVMSWKILAVEGMK